MMKTGFVLSSLFAAALALALTGPADAGGFKRSRGGASQHPQSDYYRGGSQVRGYRRRGGGYSYNYIDGITDYRDDSVFLDPDLAQGQDCCGPFDSGFFFDSDVSPLNNAPYPN